MALINRRIWHSQLCAACILAWFGAGVQPMSAQTQSQQKQVVVSKTVTGVVVDENNEPLIGAVVADASDKNNGTLTNIDGEFTLALKKGDAINVSFIGYATVTVHVGAENKVRVVLKEDNVLDEVVVVGYGVQKKGSVTGSVVSVNSKEINVTKTANVTNALAGKLPGLRVVQRSGQPGADGASLEIRNYGTPLVIVDGFERSLSDLDPNDIESISVLKDASAAVYGFKGGNGVILVTTKKGSEGAPKITYDGNVGWQSITKFPKLYNAYQYANVQNEIAAISGKPMPWTDDEIARFAAGEGTDWMDEVIRDNAPIYNHNLSVSGGSERTKYFFSLGYMNQESIYKSNCFNFKRYNVRSNITTRLAEGLNVDLQVFGRLDERQDPHQDKNIIRVIEMALPYKTVFANNNPDYYNGTGDWNNPVQQMDVDQVGFNRRRRYEFDGSVSLRWDLPWVKGLQLKGTFRYDYYSEHNKNFHPQYTTYNYNAETDSYDVFGTAPKTSLSQNMGYWYKPAGQISASYNNEFGKNSVSALVLYEFSKYKNQWLNGYRQFDTGVIPELDKGVKDNQSTGGSSNETAMAGLVGRVNYAYDNRYLLELSFRYDGSYKFARGSRWGFFPGVSLGWRLSQEKFFQKALPFIQNFKVRASIAKFGNQDDFSAYIWQDGYNYPSGNYLMGSGNYVSGTQDRGDTNKILTWVDVKTENIGFEWTMWDGLFGGEFDYYRRYLDGKKANQNAVLPTTFGQPMPDENLNKEMAQGWELQLSHRNRVGDVNYSVIGNLSMSRWYKKYQYMTPPSNSYQNWRNNQTDRVQGVTWGYEALGQFQNYEDILNSPIQDGNGNKSLRPGDIKYADLNGDGIISDLDQKPISHNNNPFIHYGLNLFAEWKGIDLTLFFQGAAGHEVYFNSNDLTEPLFQQGLGNGFTALLDHWRLTDPTDPSSEWIPGFYPSFREGSYQDNIKTSTYWKSKQDYLRLKTIEVGYSIPQKYLQKIHLSNVRVYVNGTNLFTIKGGNKGMGKYCDPESNVTNFQYYPQMKSYTVGLRVTL